MLRLILNLVVSAVILGLIVYFLRLMLGTDPKALARMIDRADKLVVVKDVNEIPTILFESADRKDLDALKRSLHVRLPREFMHCMCFGAERIELYANGETIGWISNQHSKNIRFSEWRSDAEILDVEAFLKWFDDRKIPGPRDYLENEKKRDKESQEHERKWLAAMPSSLEPHWPQMRNSFDVNVEPLGEALAKQIPEQNARILALFSWYGFGAGRWSGFPIYENVPEKMLFAYSTADLLAAANRESLTEAQTEGAARFFGGWTFSQRRPNDLELLPADLKSRLLKHSLKNTDDDKRRRATKAFAEK